MWATCVCVYICFTFDSTPCLLVKCAPYVQYTSEMDSCVRFRRKYLKRVGETLYLFVYGKRAHQWIVILFWTIQIRSVNPEIIYPNLTTNSTKSIHYLNVFVFFLFVCVFVVSFSCLVLFFLSLACIVLIYVISPRICNGEIRGWTQSAL